MIFFLLKLVLAHLLGDFLLQPDSWVRDKFQRKLTSPYLYLHVGIHGLLLLLLLGPEYWVSILLMSCSHYVIDLVKLYLQNEDRARWLFFADQLCHLLVLLGITYFHFPFSLYLLRWYTPGSLLLLVAILTVTQVGSIMIRLLMSRWHLAEDRPEDSLIDAGRYIGILERLLVFLFVLIAQWQAVGLLIAAKSILRFSDLSRAKDRKLTEYVLIGTLLSIGFALVVALIYSWLRGLLESSI